MASRFKRKPAAGEARIQNDQEEIRLHKTQNTFDHALRRTTGRILMGFTFLLPMQPMQRGPEQFTVISSSVEGNYAAGIVSLAPVLSNEIIGYANIRAIGVSRVFTPTTGKSIPGNYTASLQFNTFFFVQKGDTKYLFWLQNYAQISPNKKIVSFSDQIWPVGSTYNINVNQFQDTTGIKQLEINSLKGSGGTYSSRSDPFYAVHFDKLIHYKLPLSVLLTDTIVKGKIYVKYQIGNSDPVTSDVIKTDLGKPNVFLTSDNIGAFGKYSSSLVLCAGGNYNNATFSPNTNVLLGLYYNKGNRLAPFSTIVSPDQNNPTGESASNLAASIDNKGYLDLHVGKANKYIDNKFDPNIPKLLRG